MHKPKPAAPPPVARVWEFFETYTRDLRADDFQRLFTRETPEAWQFFAKAIKADETLGDLELPSYTAVDRLAGGGLAGEPGELA